jgi:P pilus assembly chaperone PapD
MRFHNSLCRGTPRRSPVWRFLAFGAGLALTAAGFAEMPAHAAGGLVVTPQLVELDNANRNQVLTLANRGTEAETYRISIINYRMDGQGDLHLTDTPAEGEGFAGALFRNAPRQITLEPGQPQTVRILYRRPANLQEGEYRSHLLFQQVPKALPSSLNAQAVGGLSMQIRTVFGVTVPVIVRHGRLEAEGALTALKPIERADGTPGIALRIARGGAKSLRGDLVALLGGEEVGRLNNVAVYLSTPHRDVELALDPARLPQGSGNEVVVEYRERPDKGAATIGSALLRLR